MSTSVTTDALATLRQRGFVEQLSDEVALAQRLNAGPTVFYAGFDPTAASLHVGHYIPLLAMAHLSRAGHQAIAVLGGGTAMVGDPSGKTEMRQLITPEAIAANRDSIAPQVRRIIGDSARVVDNGDWILPLNYIQFLRDIGRHFSVNRMLSAEAYKMRLEKGLSFIEFNYQLLQAYDFLALNERFNCALQIGGDDQWGNILAGIDLVRRVRQQETFGLTFPLLTTASGAKMGKTAAGAVWLDPRLTPPYDFFQYFVNVDDRDVVRFLKLLTFEPLEEIRRFEATEGADLREAKRLLAHAVTTIVHGRAVADEAQAAARSAFGGRRRRRPVSVTHRGPDGRTAADWFETCRLAGRIWIGSVQERCSPPHRAGRRPGGRPKNHLDRGRAGPGRGRRRRASCFTPAKNICAA